MLNIRNELILIQLLLHSSCKCCWAKKEKKKKTFPFFSKINATTISYVVESCLFFIVLVCNIIVHEKKHHVLQCLENLRRICYIADHRSIFFWFVHFWYQLLHYVVLWFIWNTDCLSYIVVCHHPKAGGGAWQTAGVGSARNMGGGQDNLWMVISSSIGI